MKKIASPRELQAELQAIQEYIRTFDGKPDREVLASKLRDLADRVATAKRPGPYLEIDGKVWRVVAFQPHKETGPVPNRTIGEIGWGRIQKVTKKGKTTGKEVEARFFPPPKISVGISRGRYMSTTYKDLGNDWKSKTASYEPDESERTAAESKFKKGQKATYKGKPVTIVEVAGNGKVTVKAQGGAVKTMSPEEAEKSLKTASVDYY